MSSLLAKAVAALGQPIARVGVAAAILIPHGAQKLFGWFGGQGLEASAQIFAFKFGLPPVLVLLAGLVEFFGGLLLAVGLFTRSVAAVLTVMAVLTVSVLDWQAGFSLATLGMPLLWGAVCLTLALRGGGTFSVDSVIDRCC